MSTISRLPVWAISSIPISAPPFRGEPKCIRIELPIHEFTNLLWNSLNEQNKVSLFVRYVDLETGEVEQEIRNKNAE